jgi:hypothetical protein
MMPRRVTISVAVVAAAAVLTGCAGGGHGPTHSTTTTVASSAAPPDTGSLVCNQAIDLRHPGSTGLHVVLGVVALPTAPAYEALQTSRTGMHGRLRLFAKTGLVIKPHTRFELVLGARQRRRMAISWGNADTSPPRGRLIVNDCGRGETTGSKWLVYAGGYYVSHPACLPLVVVAGGRRQRVRIGVGAPCPGQRPPAGPSQT